MAKKITISVPDELHKKMKQWQASFNFSKVFQKAISNLIHKKEELQRKIKMDFDLPVIIERLKTEKLEFETNYLEKGRLDALRWVKIAHYADIQYALKWTPKEDPTKDEKLGAYFSERLKNFIPGYLRVDNKYSSEGQKRINNIISNYITGWKEGLEVFWNEIKDKI